MYVLFIFWLIPLQLMLVAVGVGSAAGWLTTLPAPLEISPQCCDGSPQTGGGGSQSDGGVAAHNGSTKTAVLPVSPRKNFLRRLVVSMLFGPSDGSPPKGRGGLQGGGDKRLLLSMALLQGKWGGGFRWGKARYA